MKKTYKNLILFFCACALPFAEVNAQPLNGNYSIDQAAAASATNFTSFNAFATAINVNGVSGPVNVAVMNGPYVEQVTLNQIPGASATNPVVINGDNNLLTYNASSTANGWTLRLNGTDFLKVNNLKIQGTGSSVAFACLLTNSANNNVFSFCTFSVNANVTSSSCVPFVLSATSTGATSTGSSSGNDNLITDCHVYSGYYGITMTGLTTAPYNLNNVVRRCLVQDFYYAGLYTYYQWSMQALNNTFECPTRTTNYYRYMLMQYYAQNCMVDGNIFQKPFDASPTQTSYDAYGVYAYNYFFPAKNAGKNIFQNNIVRNFRTGYYNTGLLLQYDCIARHNTVSFDNSASTNIYTTYGIQSYGQTGQSNVVQNNNVSVTNGGSATKYGIYISPASLHMVDGNNIWVGGTGTNYYVGYNVFAQATFAAWQSSGMDPNGSNINPIFVNNVTDQHPTNAALNNKAIPLGILFDQEIAIRNSSTPDVGALEFMTPICGGTPGMTVAGPTFALCPGETADFSIGNLSSDLGYTYAWYTSSLSAVGPWNPISTPNSITASVPNVTNTTWVSAVISCTAVGGTSIQPVAQVNVASTTTNTIPYYEDFEGIGLDNRLPNCSWMAPNLGSTARTYAGPVSSSLLPKSGNAFGAFNNSFNGSNDYFTNGIWMDAGVTYSASLWYRTDFNGGSNWSDMTISYGTAQSTSAMTLITHVGPASSAAYKSLSGTFSVATSGLYNVAVSATVNGAGSSNLSWDDLRIEIPCQLGNNAPSLTASTNNGTVCAGDPVVLNASGAHMYKWSTGASGPSTTEYPPQTTVFSVIGSHSVTGCTSTFSVPVMVKPSPTVTAFAFPPTICPGKSTLINASGAVNFMWSNNSPGANITVSPSAPTTYTVIGTNLNGCSGRAVVYVGLHPQPNVTGGSSTDEICLGEPVTLFGSGAITYEWVSTTPAIVLNGNNFNTFLPASTTFTLNGTDANGCVGSSQVSAITVMECVGLDKLVARYGLSVFPNPAADKVTVQLNGVARITLTDVTGRQLLQTRGSENIDLNLSSFAAGVYYIGIDADGISTSVKLIKQ